MDPKMNSTESSSVSLQNATSGFCPIKPQHISISVLICLTFLAGLLLNVFILWVFTCRTAVWKPGTVLQFNLAVSDVIICPLGPFMSEYIHTANWRFGKALCQLKAALIISHICSSILFLTLISIHRYVLVVCYKRVSYMNRKDFVQKLCVGVWLFALGNGAVFGALLDSSAANNHTLCLSIHQKQNINIYFITNFAVLIPGSLLAITVSAICYSILVRSMSRRLDSHDKGQAIKRKSHKMIAVCLAIFVICFIPVNVVRSVLITVKKFFPHKCSLLLEVETAFYLSWILAGANCCLDPIIYCFSSQNFTNSFHISLSKIRMRLERRHHESSDCPHVS